MEGGEIMTADELIAALPLVNLGTLLGLFMSSQPVLWDQCDQVGPYIKNRLPKTWKILVDAGILPFEITRFVSERCSDVELPYPKERLAFLSPLQQQWFLVAQARECVSFLPKEHKVLDVNALLPFVTDELEVERKGGFGSVRKVSENGVDLCRKELPWVTEQHKSEAAKELEILQNLPAAPHLLQLRASYIQGCRHYLLLYPWVTTDLDKFIDRPESFRFWEEKHIQDRPLLIISWFRCISAALATMHSHLVKYIDIKPANIGLQVKGEDVSPFLLDYGHSRAFSRNSDSQALEVYGTLFYESPEKLERRLEGRSGDVFSLGVVFMQLLSILSTGVKRKWEKLVRADRLHPIPASSMLRSPGWYVGFFDNEHPVMQKLGEIVVDMLRLDSTVRPSARAVYSRLTAEWKPLVLHCEPIIKHPSPKKPLKTLNEEEEEEEVEEVFEEIDTDGGPIMLEMFSDAYLM